MLVRLITHVLVDILLGTAQVMAAVNRHLGNSYHARHGR